MFVTELVLKNMLWFKPYLEVLMNKGPVLFFGKHCQWCGVSAFPERYKVLKAYAKFDFFFIHTKNSVKEIL